MFFKYILLITLMCQSLLFAEVKHMLLCIGEDEQSIEILCPQYNNTRILILDNHALYDDAIFSIQTKIRDLITKDKKISLTILSKGIAGTLSAISQGNMLPYYRKHIKGLILVNTYAKLLKACPLKKKSTSPSFLCQNIKKLHAKHKKEASLFEVTQALSPALQMDWYYPKVLLVDKQQSTQYNAWIKAFNENNIPYESAKTLNNKEMQSFINTVPKLAKEPMSKIPNYYGPILRFHLGKIYYKPKNTLTIWHDLHYGKSKQQTYDVYFKENSKQNNKLLIYVHGGGWKEGDKSHYTGLAKQFSDKGFTVVTVNYRYLNLPNIGMEQVINDVKRAIDKIVNSHKKYHFDKKRTIVMGESTGAYLLYMALSKEGTKRIKVAILNSMPSDLAQYTKKKQIILSGMKNQKQREKWLEKYSPLKNLKHYKTDTLAIHSMDDKVVPAKHLKELDLYSVIHYENIEAYWVLNAGHPVSPTRQSMLPSYQELEQYIDRYIDKHFAILYERKEEE